MTKCSALYIARAQEFLLTLLLLLIHCSENNARPKLRSIITLDHRLLKGAVCVLIVSVALDQRSANYSPWANSSPLPVCVTNVLLEHSRCPFIYLPAAAFTL